MLTQTFEKPTWLTNVIKRLDSIAAKGILNTIVFVLVLLLLGSVAILLTHLAPVAAAGTPH
jgi:hypothetical protein